MGLTVVQHPLVADRVARLRDEATDSATFRRLAAELGTMLAYEAFRDLATTPVSVRTPLGLDAPGARLASPWPLLVPILRAGLGLLDGVLAALPTAEVGAVGFRRNEETFEPEQYFVKLPEDLGGRDAIVLDPMLATGGSLAATCALVGARGAGRITAICLIAAPEGAERVEQAVPGVRIFTAALDEGLDERAFIVPGLGDAGDRLYGPG